MNPNFFFFLIFGWRGSHSQAPASVQHQPVLQWGKNSRPWEHGKSCLQLHFPPFPACPVLCCAVFFPCPKYYLEVAEPLMTFELTVKRCLISAAFPHFWWHILSAAQPLSTQSDGDILWGTGHVPMESWLFVHWWMKSLLIWVHSLFFFPSRSRWKWNSPIFHTLLWLSWR